MRLEPCGGHQQLTSSSPRCPTISPFRMGDGLSSSMLPMQCRNAPTLLHSSPPISVKIYIAGPRATVEGQSTATGGATGSGGNAMVHCHDRIQCRTPAAHSERARVPAVKSPPVAGLPQQRITAELRQGGWRRPSRSPGCRGELRQVLHQHCPVLGALPLELLQMPQL